ncbi:hypothetical protein FVD15_03860 [Campylobacter volucris]|uniref:Uncharacterized protein n=1 Tax=Campylobacter volucris TaxID=1031542 RepID=A0AAE5YIS9_9BACT|nr:hypothetical protein [Campylobacter volucris]AJC93906.1 hypothetical protein CVOL_0588 [Campylobacter volucris LMG 24379]KAB0580070.1 hypothetical protein F7P61_00200 [Campylobacter volucris]QBL13715.1 hypothetical protein A9460_05000 [Campylobacter volucris]QEL08120.1 hypothetical protein CVOLT_0590 [Campylobacter volucris]TXK70123.1 hypothetical protein FVD15_03860 [Campylobacter volucris]
MHGKIMVYVDGTGRGTVINLAKTFFEFNKHAWHDKRSMPAVGMFVEFRSDGKHITDLRPSKFQEFGENDFIKERDFWKTDSDDELEDLRLAKRDAYVQDLYRQTDYDELDKIPLNMTIPQAIQRYFYNETLCINAVKDISTDEVPYVIDFFALKRFLYKALDTLLFSDNTINQADFSVMKNIIVHLEMAYKDMKDKQKNINMERLYDEVFLSHQCHYQALLASLDNRKNRKLALERQMSTLASEIKSKQARLEAESGKKHQELEELIHAKKQKLVEIKSEMDYFSASVEKLEALKKSFYEKNFTLFSNSFNMAREKLFDKIKQGLNICATKLDLEIWMKSLKSTSIKNSYFKNATEISFCTLSFAELYLNRLNKNALNPNDQLLLSYVKKVKKECEKNFLIVSSNPEVYVNMKIQIFAMNPYYVVKHAPKKVNYQGLMKNTEFDVVYVDEKTIWAPVADVILEGKYFLKKDSKTKFKIL